MPNKIKHIRMVKGGDAQCMQAIALMMTNDPKTTI